MLTFSAPSCDMTDLTPVVSGGIGLLGVAVGLTGDLIRRHWQRPKLELQPYVAENGDGVYFDVFTEESHAIYLRLRVRNSGRGTARSVEVVIEHIELCPDGLADDPRRQAFEHQDVSLLLGRRLKWADREEPALDIPSGSARRVDIAHVTTTEPRYQAGGLLAVPMRMTLNKSSRIHRDVLSGTSYVVTVSITAANCESRAYRFVLKFGGHWLGRATMSADHGAFVISDVEQTTLR